MGENQHGDGTGNPNGDDDASKYVTQEQLATVVNAAVSNHMKRLDTKLNMTIGNAVAEALKANQNPPPDDDDDDDDDLNPPPKGKANPEITSLKRQITQLTNKLTKAEDARASEATQRRKAGLKSAVIRELGEAGLSGQHLRGARAVLYDDGRVHVDDEGNHLFRDADGVDVPLADGLKEWVASDDAKLFQKPTEVRGSGDGPNDQKKLPKLKNDELSQAHADAVEGVSKFLLNQ